MAVEVNGNKPSGTITIKDEEVVMSSIELTIGDYTVAYDVTNEAYVATKIEENGEGNNSVSKIIYR